MKKLTLGMLTLSSLMIVACADHKMHKDAPPTHQSPAALDMRGDCMTPPCGDAANPQAYR